MKTSKRIVSFLLSAIMVVTTFLAVGPVFTIEAEAADINIGGITQTRVVGNYESVYAGYQARFFGEETDDNWPTNFVIPGLSSSNDYTPQGMTYWAAKEWILISAYDASGAGKNSVIYALDAKTTNFVALFKIKNKDGTVNTSHGGGIAASEHNFYFADTASGGDEGSNISYWPLAEMDVPVNTVKEVSIYDTINCGGELNGSNTSYCCYDEGILWTGNFYHGNEPAYDSPANSKYHSMLIGYKLVGSNSADEWAYLKGRYNKPITITAASGEQTISDGTIKWKAMEAEGLVTVSGSITAPTAYVGEFCPSFGSFNLTQGVDYTIEFTSTNRSSDLYIFAPNGGGHTNVKQSSQTTITELADGTFHYKMNFTAGIKPVGADSAWPATLPTTDIYTGTYTIRFDQDAIQAGEARNFTMSNIRISETPINALKLTTTGGTVTRTNASMTYSITEDTSDGTFDITGTATNTSGSKLELTANYAKVPLVEGETYTMEFIADNQLTDAYIFAPSSAPATHMRMFAQRGEALGDGRYKYSTTFTAGKRLEGYSGGDYTWPALQNLDGSFTGMYTIRFDQDDIQNGETRNFNITDIKLRKADGAYLDEISPQAGSAGDPTYCIALNDDLDKVQYAMVDKGRIYISRSWSRSESTHHIRELVIGNININAPGTEMLTINGSQRLCHVVNSGDVTKFGGNKDNANRTQMLYMGEALCVIDDYLYMFGESAAWNYNGKGDKCPEPIDVIWKIDQYKIMGLSRPTEDIEASHYVKVESIAEITDNDEYIIAYESSQKDPVTQKNILYAIDAFGGYGENKLPKADVDGTNTFIGKTTGDSMGIVCYPITRYSAEEVEDEDGNKETHLHFESSDDANKSIRWKISGASNEQLRLQNMDFYYNNYPYLYFDGRLFGMAEKNTNTALLNYLKIRAIGNGKFYINYSDAYYLWCVDGTNADYQNLYTNYYSNHGITDYNPSYSGLEEVAGTVHSDGLYQAANTTNKSGCLIGTGGVGDNIHYGQFNIYKRVPDQHTSVYDTRVFTDLTAELQPDGTYDLTLEAYTTNKVQFQKVDPRPTDFVLLLDASGSMTNNSDCTGYRKYDGSSGNVLEVDSMIPSGDTEVDHDNDEGKYGYDKTNGKNIYYKLSSGDYCRLYAAYYNETCDVPWWVQKVVQNYWLYYQDPRDNLYYILDDATDAPISGVGGLTKTELVAKITSNSNYTNRADNTSNGTRRGTKLLGVHYEYMSGVTRLEALKTAVEGLTYKIEKEAVSSGLDHRIALVQFGSSDYQSDNWLNTGMYRNDGTFQQFVANNGSGNQVTVDDYKNAFFNKANFNKVRNAVNGIVTDQGDPDTFSNYGMQMARYIVDNSDASYLADGDRSACIIMITDGVPGLGGDQAEVANIVANDAIGQASNAKAKGTYVYTVQMGSNSMSGFDMNAYMDYVSSEYIEATSMSDSGERNIAEVDYRIDVPTGSAFNLDNLVNDMFNSVTSNSTNALAKLDENSVIREVLNTDAFVYTDKTEFLVGTAAAAYDGLGRLYFEEMQAGSGVDYEFDESTSTFTVTGFDYSTRYVSPSNLGAGKAAEVVIKVTNVLPNPDKIISGNDETDMSSVPVSIDARTGVYQNEDNMLNKNFKQKGFPVERIEIPEYTYALDYGTTMLDTDINGVLMSVDDELVAQVDSSGNISYKTALDTGNMNLTFAGNSEDMIYSIKPTTDGRIDNSKGYVLIRRDDGTYDWFRINVVPASNVYYEETAITRKASSNPDWVAKGTKEFDGQDIASSSDVYGKDSRYVNSTKEYSNNTYYQATVSQTNKTSDVATFTFTGTGFDLFSACGPNTGIQVVNVKKGGTHVKSYIVDTYYSDATYSGTLTQVPIVRFSGAHSTYTIESTAAYLPSISGALKSQSVESQVIGENGVVSYTTEFAESYENEILRELGFEELIGEDVEFVSFSEDSVLNGGEGPFAVEEGAFTTQSLSALENYIDGIRIYNPLGSDYSNYIPSEQGVQYFNVIDSLASSDGMVEGTANTGVAFVQGSFADGFTFADYNKAATGAPKNEFYLKGDSSVTNALSFTVKGWSSNKRVMISARVAKGNSVSMYFNGSTSPISNKTEVYYDITQWATVNAAGDEATFVISNQTPNTLLAINNIKVTDSTNAVQPITFGSLSVVEDILSLPVTEVDINAPIYPTPDNVGELPEVSPIIPDENPEPDDGDDDSVIDEPSDDSFFAKVESFFKKIFVFFKNIFDKVSSIFTV